jgi:hypothetical protein
MKLVFGSLSDSVAELHNQKVSECRLLTLMKTDTIQRYYQVHYTYWAVLTAKLGDTMTECRIRTAEYYHTPVKNRLPKSVLDCHERRLKQIEQVLRAEGITFKKGVWMAEDEELEAALDVSREQCATEKEIEHVQP